MATSIQPTPTPPEHIFDPTVTFKPRKVKHYEKGATLSTQPQTAQEVWKQQKAHMYSGEPKQRKQEKVHAEKVLSKAKYNQDGRERIPKTTEWPYAFHAQLSIKMNNKTYGGSGALVGPHHLLTCGHNVYNAKKQRWAQEITVYPALNDGYAPFGEVKVVKVYTFTDWTDHGDQRYDIALLILNQSIGRFTGWGGLLCTSDAELTQEKVNIVGYPGDKGMKQMWGMEHTIAKISPEEFDYDIDTCPGQSGSAIWIDKYGNPMILGVHTLGGDSSNSGVRISEQKFREIVRKISETFILEPAATVPFANPGLQKPAVQPPAQRAASLATSPSHPASVSDMGRLVGTTATPATQAPVQSTEPVVTPARQPTLVPAMAFGAAAYKTYWGAPGIEKPLPPNIEEILDRPCPVWPGKKIRDTHTLNFKTTVNGKPLSLDYLGELVQNPLQGHASNFDFLSTGDYKSNAASDTSYWFFMTRDVIPGTENIPFAEKQKVLERLGQKANIAYEVPSVVDQTLSIFGEKVRYGTHLYDKTVGLCQEQYNASYHLIVGDFAADGLVVGYSRDGLYGVGGLWKL